MDDTPIERRILVVASDEATSLEFRRILDLDVADGDLATPTSAPPAAPGAALRFAVDSALGPCEALRCVQQSLSESRRYSLAFVDFGPRSSADARQAIENVSRADPDIQIVVCLADADRTWPQIQARMERSDELILLKVPLDAAEVQQLARALTRKWRQARHDSLHDSLTNLPNRALLMDRLRRFSERAQRHREYGSALLFLDIDNFKTINDSMGHSVGDQLLVEFAGRLQAAVRGVDTATRLGQETTARMGGDEFVVLLDGVSQPSDAVAVARRILEHVSRPVTLDGQRIALSASIGIALSGDCHADADELMRRADIAMYRAKQAGKARYALFDETMHAEVTGRLDLESALHAACDRNEFRVLYEPIVSLDTGRIIAFEALLRWMHPRRGMVLPGEFIPVAEETGVIIPLGRWVLRETCRQLREWNASRSHDQALSISVNVSRRQLVERGFADDVEQILHETGIDPHCVNLEITESAVISALEPMEHRLRILKECGLQLHMDDFGTGYSSLSCIHRLPIDVVKIDRAFVTQMERSREYSAIVHAIVTLARNLGLRVTAEGLETEDQLTQVVSLDCDYGQGFYFSGPLDAEAAAQLVQSQDFHWSPARRAVDSLPTPAGNDPRSDGAAIERRPVAAR